MPTEPKCETCRFYEHAFSECRRRSPVVLDSGRDGCRWPDTEPDDWCGEHEPREGEPRP